MSIKKYKPEQIATVLRQIELQMVNRKTPTQACKKAGIHTQVSTLARDDPRFTALLLRINPEP